MDPSFGWSSPTATPFMVSGAAQAKRNITSRSAQDSSHLGVVTLRNPRLSLEFAHQRDDLLAELLELLLEVQEAEEEEVDPAPAVLDDASGDLLGCADELRAEPVVVLDEVRGLFERISAMAAGVSKKTTIRVAA